MKNNNNLNPNYVTGFADGESCWSVKIVKNNKLKTGWGVLLVFSIELSVKDIHLLNSIQSFFGVGNIGINNIRKTATYSVTSIKDLVEVIIPHFCKYPLITQKRADFELFKAVVELVKAKEHLTMEGINNIVSIKASLNWGLSELLLKYFPNVLPTARPSFAEPDNIDPHWLSGFSEAEGCFDCSIRKSKTHTNGYQILLRFTLVQHLRDYKIINKFWQFFNCGVLGENSSCAVFTVTKLSDIHEKIVPFFVKYPLQGLKLDNFKDFCRIEELMINKHHLTIEGVEEIRAIKERMNKKRV